MACDRCKALGTELVTLLEHYQTDTVKQICMSCETVVNAHLRKLRGVSLRWTERKMKLFIDGQTAPVDRRTSLRKFFDRVMAPGSIPGAIIRLPH